MIISKGLVLALIITLVVHSPALAAEDSDGDSLTDEFEIFLSLTDPNNADSDADGIHDGNEDLDSDGLTNAQEQQYMMDPLLSAVDAGGYLLEKEIREDAESKTTDRWLLISVDRPKRKGKSPRKSKGISNIADPEDPHNRVIIFKKKRLFNLKGSFPEYSQSKIQWDMKFRSNYMILVICETTHGPKFLYYTGAPKQFKFGWGPFIHHGLGKSSRKGKRITVRRDLQSDIWEVFPACELKSIRSFYIEGKGLIDNIITSAYADSDYDFIPDHIEDAVGLDKNDPVDALGDIDGDGITNVDEFFAGTLGIDVDLDNDGMPDKWEITYFGNLERDGTGDFDGDGISDADEAKYGTDPTKPNTPSAEIEFSLDSATVVESQGTATIQISLSQAEPIPVSALVKIKNSTATNGSDFTFISPQTLTFAPGETTKNITVTVIDDGITGEPKEHVIFELKQIIWATPGEKIEHILYISENETLDTDDDGLPDWWEMKYFNTLKQGATGDPDQDKMDNLKEYLLGRHPNAGALKDSDDRLKFRSFVPKH